MNDDLNEFIQNTSDAYLFELLTTIFNRAFPEDNILRAILSLSRKHGMPVKNIMPFIQDLADWCKEHQPMSAQDTQSLADLLSNSGFLTIGFSREGDDPIGNG